MKQLLNLFQRLINALLVLMLSGMVALTLVDVLGRKLLNAPVFGANDLTEHLMAIIIFSGLPLLTAQREHLSVDLFDRWLLTPGWKNWHKVVDVLIAAVLALVAWEYFLAIQEAQWMNEVSPALLIPRSWMYTFICITTSIAAIAALLVSAPKPHISEEVTS